MTRFSIQKTVVPTDLVLIPFGSMSVRDRCVGEFISYKEDGVSPRP